MIRNYFRAACSSVPPIYTSSICVQRQVFCATGGFPLGVRCGEDTALWAKCALISDVVVSRRLGAVYHQVGTENNTRFRYFGSDAYFDYLSLLEGQSDFPYYDDLEKYAAFKMYEIAVAALVHDDDRDTAWRMLRRVDSGHWRGRRQLVRSLLLLPPTARRVLFRLKQRMKAVGTS